MTKFRGLRQNHIIYDVVATWFSGHFIREQTADVYQKNMVEENPSIPQGYHRVDIVVPKLTVVCLLATVADKGV